MSILVCQTDPVSDPDPSARTLWTPSYCWSVNSMVIIIGRVIIRITSHPRIVLILATTPTSKHPVLWKVRIVHIFEPYSMVQIQLLRRRVNFTGHKTTRTPGTEKRVCPTKETKPERDGSEQVTIGLVMMIHDGHIQFAIMSESASDR